MYTEFLLADRPLAEQVYARFRVGAIRLASYFLQNRYASRVTLMRDALLLTRLPKNLPPEGPQDTFYVLPRWEDAPESVLQKIATQFSGVLPASASIPNQARVAPPVSTTPAPAPEAPVPPTPGVAASPPPPPPAEASPQTDSAKLSEYVAIPPVGKNEPMPHGFGPKQWPSPKEGQEGPTTINGTETGVSTELPRLTPEEWRRLFLERRASFGVLL
jgi:hypothetical protein